MRAPRVRCDWILSFYYAKGWNAAYATGVIDSASDVSTWTGMESDNKLIISWPVSQRPHHFPCPPTSSATIP